MRCRRPVQNRNPQRERPREARGPPTASARTILPKPHSTPPSQVLLPGQRNPSYRCHRCAQTGDSTGAAHDSLAPGCSGVVLGWSGHFAAKTDRRTSRNFFFRGCIHRHHFRKQNEINVVNELGLYLKGLLQSSLIWSPKPDLGGHMLPVVAVRFRWGGVHEVGAARSTVLEDRPLRSSIEDKSP